MRFYTVLLFVFCSVRIFSQSIYFADALAEGKVLVTITSEGGHSGKCISVHFERLTDKPFRIKIPAGHVFECADSLVQDIIVVKTEEFALNNKKQFIKVEGMCCEAHHGSPSTSSAYTIGALAKEQLRKMAEYIHEKALWAEGDAQLAIWCMSDSFQTAGIRHPGLLNMACQLLGQPLPQYKVNYPKPNTNQTPARTPNARPRPVIEKTPLSVEGSFDYYTKEDTEISIVVKNEAGETVKTIFEHQPHAFGTAKYSFSYKTTKLPSGNYEVVLMDKERAVKKIKIKY